MISKKDTLNKKEIINRLIWGTHICYFYQTKQELIDFIIPYFQVGINNNECCMWIISDNLNLQDSENYLRKTVKNFDDISKRGQIKIIPYSEWYLENDVLNYDKVIENWLKHLNKALANGFNGLRISGDLNWIGKEHLARFIDYEIEINKIIREYKVMAVCTYPINKFTKLELLNIANSHQFVLINEAGKYDILEHADRRLINEERKIFQSYLQRIQKMETLGIISSGIAHDFKNLLNLIIGNTDMALLKINEENVSYNYLNEISRYSSSASVLLDRMFDFSFSDKEVKKSINLNSIINNLNKMLDYLKLENIQVETNLHPDLWTININPVKTEQVILNLIINAKEAMPEGGKITISTENIKIDKILQRSHPDTELGNFICLTIKDTGVGIKDDLINRIFEPFFTTKELGKGTGIGLPIAKLYITENKGCIEVESEVNKGTTFKIFLPAQKTL